FIIRFMSRYPAGWFGVGENNFGADAAIDAVRGEAKAGLHFEDLVSHCFRQVFERKFLRSSLKRQTPHERLVRCGFGSSGYLHPADLLSARCTRCFRNTSIHSVSKSRTCCLNSSIVENVARG